MGQLYALLALPLCPAGSVNCLVNLADVSMFQWSYSNSWWAVPGVFEQQKATGGDSEGEGGNTEGRGLFWPAHSPGLSYTEYFCIVRIQTLFFECFFVSSISFCVIITNL